MLTDPFAKTDIDVLDPKPSEIRDPSKLLSMRLFSQKGRKTSPFNEVHLPRGEGLSADTHSDAEWNRTKSPIEEKLSPDLWTLKVPDVKVIVPAPGE